MILLLKNLLFTLAVPGTVAFYLPVWLALRNGDSLGGPFTAQRAVGAVVLAISAAVYFWSLYYFVTDGRATPAPIDPPKVLVIRGPYRFVRNPMYVDVGLALTGWSLWFNDAGLLWYLAGYLAIAMTFVRLYEEPTLQRLFGPQYDRYRAHVRAWIPGKPWSG